MPANFAAAFEALTGHPPLPWQAALYDLLKAGNPPPACVVPPGLGKTAVIAVWLAARHAAPARVPTRLVYVVNRRTVVDQTTDEAEAIRARAAAAYPTAPPLAVSTLRGQFADNGDWYADPAAPAVVVGTVDMVGSRLLFCGYRAGKGSRPLYAGFLGQDALVVHDEAHLEPAFQKTLRAVEDEQRRDGSPKPIRVMALTATAREAGPAAALGLSPADHAHPVVARRYGAAKALTVHRAAGPAAVAATAVKLALEFRDAGRAVLVYLTGVDDVRAAAAKLTDKVGPDRVGVLTGTIRGRERERLLETPVYRRFLPGGGGGETVYLVCTSAGEVGVNISAGAMVCDLAAYDRMAQRLGRVNRFGDEPTPAPVHVVCPPLPAKPAGGADDGKPDRKAKLRLTLALLEELVAAGGAAGPKALDGLDPAAREAAMDVPRGGPPLTADVLDAWALTSVRAPVGVRQPVAPYLRGDDQTAPEVQVGWRTEVGLSPAPADTPRGLLEAYPVRAHELLAAQAYRVAGHLALIAARCPGVTAWVADEDGGDVAVVPAATFADEAAAWGLAGKLVLLPPAAGGLTTTGMLDGAVPYAEGVAYDVADTPARCRVFDLAKAPDKWRLVRRVTVPAAGGDEDAPARCWYWFVAPPAVKVKAGKGQKYADHVAAVFDAAAASAAALFGPALADVGAAVKEAARWHDTGKLRDEFQLVTLGNAAYNSAVLGTWAAKSDRGKGRTDGTYRHEFGSVLDAAAAGPAGCPHLSAAAYELALHLVAAHHGWARPHFPAAKAFDLAPGREQAARAQAEETPARFARLQRAYGRWGLAYIESVLRAADWAASAAS